jgi:hypothetical protein
LRQGAVFTARYSPGTDALKPTTRSLQPSGLYDSIDLVVITDKDFARKRLLDACDLLLALKPHLPPPTVTHRTGHASVFAAFQIAEAEFFDAAAEYVREHGEI